MANSEVDFIEVNSDLIIKQCIFSQLITPRDIYSEKCVIEESRGQIRESAIQYIHWKPGSPCVRGSESLL